MKGRKDGLHVEKWREDEGRRMEDEWVMDKARKDGWVTV